MWCKSHEPVSCTFSERGHMEELDFIEIYGNHYQKCYNLAHRMLNDSDDAEDIVQESFLSFWKTSRYDESKGSLSNFLLKIVQHKVMDLYDYRRVRRSIKEKMHSSSYEVSDSVCDRITLDGMLLKLTQKQRSAVYFQGYYGFTNLEVASLLNVTSEVVANRNSTGIKTMRKMLNESSSQEGAY